jgi:hypothetical protein
MNSQRAFAASLILALAVAALVGSRWDSLVSSNAPSAQIDTRTPVVATSEPTAADAIATAGFQAGEAGASTGLTSVEEPAREDTVEWSGDDDHEDDDHDYDDDDPDNDDGYDDDHDEDDDD